MTENPLIDVIKRGTVSNCCDALETLDAINLEDLADCPRAVIGFHYLLSTISCALRTTLPGDEDAPDLREVANG